MKRYFRDVLVELLGIILMLMIAVYIGDILGLAVLDLREGYEIQRLDDDSIYELPSEIYDRYGEKISEFFIYQRKLVDYEDFPDHLIRSLILMEDKRYYEHGGMDIYSIMRALVRNIWEWDIVEGGSTLTQQLAKLLFTGGEKTVSRKLIEIWLAMQIEKRYTKEEILEKYLNRIYFGHGVYGVGKASEYFFRKDVRDLEVAESAMLVAIGRAPGRYSPFKNQKYARKRHKIVLRKLVNAGDMEEEDMEGIYEGFWEKMEGRVRENPGNALDEKVDRAPYFSEYVRQFVERDFKNQLKDFVRRQVLRRGEGFEEGLTKQVARRVDWKIHELLFTGGFKIYTTLDLGKQKLALSILRDQLAKQDEVYRKQYEKDYRHLKKEYKDMMGLMGLGFFLDGEYFFQVGKGRGEVLGLDGLDDGGMGVRSEGALVSIEPGTGYIVAMVGGRGFEASNQLNRVFARRQSGSAFKSLIYGAAIESKKYHGGRIMKDEPVKYYDRGSRGYWNPRNVGGRYRGNVTVRKALRYSINTVAVKTFMDLGLERVVKFSSRVLGIGRERFGENMAISLGTTELSPMEFARGMAVYANGGRRVDPIGVLRIENRFGEVIKDFEKDLILSREKELLEGKRGSDQVISKGVAYIMTDLLKESLKRGTGRGGMLEAGFRKVGAGKTGTTQENRDVWFVGYTPYLATVVWIGFDEGLISLGRNQFGGNVAAPVWGKFMKEAHRGLEGKDFKKPISVRIREICSISGLVPSRECRKVHGIKRELFLRGAYPRKVCFLKKNKKKKKVKVKVKVKVKKKKEAEVRKESGLLGGSIQEEAGVLEAGVLEVEGLDVEGLLEEGGGGID